MPLELPIKRNGLYLRDGPEIAVMFDITAGDITEHYDGL